MELSPRKENRRLRLIELLNLKFGGKQARLADATEITANLISRYVNAKKGIGDDMRDVLAEKCGLPLDWLDMPAGSGLAGESPAVIQPQEDEWPTKVAKMGRRAEDARPLVSEITAILMGLSDKDLSEIKVYLSGFARGRAVSADPPLKQTAA